MSREIVEEIKQAMERITELLSQVTDEAEQVELDKWCDYLEAKYPFLAAI